MSESGMVVRCVGQGDEDCGCGELAWCGRECECVS